MIINIRGTSGSGKSTIVSDLVTTAGGVTRIKATGPELGKRKQPIGYALRNWDIAVLGHYETACGGCDTLPGYDFIFDHVRKGMDVCHHVVFEGLLVSEEVKRTLQLHQDFPTQLTVVELTTDVEECLRAIRSRREARGDERPLKEDNTRNRVAVIQKSCQRLRDAGVNVVKASRQEAAVMVRDWIL